MTMDLKKPLLLIISIFLLGGSLLFAGAGDGVWMTKVPERERARQNPFDSEANAVAAGAKLFHQNCSSCHGSEASGLKNRPNLHSDRIRVATPGELEWLLKNGSMKNRRSHFPKPTGVASTRENSWPPP